MGVGLTTEGFAMSKPEETKKPKPKKSAPKNVVYAMKFPPAPAGVSSFRHPLTGDMTKLKDGVYEFPKNLSKKKKDQYVRELTKAGFVDVSYIPKPKKFQLAIYIHPEHTKDNPVNGEIDLGDVKVEAENGRVTAEDEKTAKLLEDKGFVKSTTKK